MKAPARYAVVVFHLFEISKRVMTAKDLFNGKLQDFVADLASAYPDVRELKMYSSALSLAVSFSPDQPQRMFHHLVTVPFKTHIQERDEAFFITYDFKPCLEHTGLGIDLDIISRIRGLWQHMSPQDKDNVWKHLQLLVRIDERCTCQ